MTTYSSMLELFGQSLAGAHPRIAGMYDFILSADVLEHVALPVDRALEETCRLLKPRGFLAITAYCNPVDRTVEHFPELDEFRSDPRNEGVRLDRLAGSAVR